MSFPDLGPRWEGWGREGRLDARCCDEGVDVLACDPVEGTSTLLCVLAYDELDELAGLWDEGVVGVAGCSGVEYGSGDGGEGAAYGQGVLVLVLVLVILGGGG